MTTDPLDELDRWLDREFVAGETDVASVRDPHGLRALDELRRADAGTPDPAQEFVARLRSDLLDAHRAASKQATTRADARSLGLVAAPISVSEERDRRLLVLVAAAAILIAIVRSSIHWNGHGHPSVNVATAQASVLPTRVLPTVTAISTVSLVATCEAIPGDRAVGRKRATAPATRWRLLPPRPAPWPVGIVYSADPW